VANLVDEMFLLTRLFSLIESVIFGDKMVNIDHRALPSEKFTKETAHAICYRVVNKPVIFSGDGNSWSFFAYFRKEGILEL